MNRLFSLEIHNVLHALVQHLRPLLSVVISWRCQITNGVTRFSRVSSRSLISSSGIKINLFQRLRRSATAPFAIRSCIKLLWLPTNPWNGIWHQRIAQGALQWLCRCPLSCDVVYIGGSRLASLFSTNSIATAVLKLRNHFIKPPDTSQSSYSHSAACPVLPLSSPRNRLRLLRQDVRHFAHSHRWARNLTTNLYRHRL